MNDNIIELISVTQEITWNSWAVQYFFFIGLSIGGVALTVPAYLLRRVALLPLAKLGLLVALTTGLVAPAALLADLHQPARAYQFYLHFTPTSWMSWGAFLLPLFILSLLFLGWLGLYRDRRAERPAIRYVAWVTTLLAVGIALYTGSEMGILISRPLWQSEWLVAAYALSGFTGAAGLGLVLHPLLDRADEVTRRRLVNGLTIGLLLSSLFVAVWMIAGYLGVSRSGAALLRLAVEFTPFETAVLWIGMGLLVPLAMTPVRRPAIGIGAGLLALFGAWMMRWVLFIGGQGIPKNGAGFYSFDVSMNAQGLLGIIGSVGLWLLIALAMGSLQTRIESRSGV